MTLDERLKTILQRKRSTGSVRQVIPRRYTSSSESEQYTWFKATRFSRQRVIVGNDNNPGPTAA
jgi:hypothetical protein